MQNKIKQMYRRDCFIIFIVMLFLWIELGYVIFDVSTISPTFIVKIIVILTGSMVGAFSTAASIAVLVHLRKSRQELYMEDISNSQ